MDLLIRCRLYIASTTFKRRRTRAPMSPRSWSLWMRKGRGRGRRRGSRRFLKKIKKIRQGWLTKHYLISTKTSTTCRTWLSDTRCNFKTKIKKVSPSGLPNPNRNKTSQQMTKTAEFSLPRTPNPRNLSSPPCPKLHKNRKKKKKIKRKSPKDFS